MTISRIAEGRRAFLLLALLAMALFVPGIASLPVTDRDEARFAQATRQMVETGDYVNIRFQDEPRNKKPVGIHWLQAASVEVLAGGDTGDIWAYRVPSAAGLVIAALAMFAMARGPMGSRAAFFGAALFAGALLAGVEARIAKTDGFLLALIVAQQGALLRLYAAAKAGEVAPLGMAALFWAAFGGAILVKGPVGPMIAALTLGALWVADRRTEPRPRLAANLRPLAGLALAAGVAAPWFIAIMLADSDFVGQAVTEDLLPKLLGAHESHGGFPGLYLLLLPVTFWPAALLVPFGLIWAWRRRAEPAPRLLLAWALPAWLAFELIPTKLAHYVLPLYPALALMAGAVLADGAETLAGWLRRWPARIWGLVWLAAGIGLGALPIAFARIGEAPSELLSFLAAASVGATALAGAVLFWRARAQAAMAVTVPAMAVFVGLTMAGVLPDARGLWPSLAIRDLVASHGGTGGPPIAVSGYHEPSVVFALGTDTVLTTPAGAADHLANVDGARALIEERGKTLFRRGLEVHGLRAVPLGTAEGLNLSKGRMVRLTLYRAYPLEGRR